MVFELLSFGRVMYMLQYNFRERRCHNSKNSQWGSFCDFHNTFFFVFFGVSLVLRIHPWGYWRNSKQITWGHPHRRFVTPHLRDFGAFIKVLLSLTLIQKKRRCLHTHGELLHISCAFGRINFHSTSHQEGGWQVVRCVKRSKWNHLNKWF